MAPFFTATVRPDPAGGADQGATGVSTHMASELAGLLSAPRSMNVRCKEPEKWTLETPACLTKNLRTCAASALSAVEPAREACGFERPATRPLRANSTNRTPEARPTRASM